MSSQPTWMTAATAHRAARVDELGDIDAHGVAAVVAAGEVGAHAGADGRHLSLPHGLAVAAYEVAGAAAGDRRSPWVAGVHDIATTEEVATADEGIAADEVAADPTRSTHSVGKPMPMGSPLSSPLMRSPPPIVAARAVAAANEVTAGVLGSAAAAHGSASAHGIAAGAAAHEVAAVVVARAHPPRRLRRPDARLGRREHRPGCAYVGLRRGDRRRADVLRGAHVAHGRLEDQRALQVRPRARAQRQ